MIQLGRSALIILLSGLTVLATAQIKTNKEIVTVKSNSGQTTSLKSSTGLVLTYALVIEDDIMQSRGGDNEDGESGTINDDVSSVSIGDAKNTTSTASVLRQLAQEIKIYPIPANTFANIDLGQVKVKRIDVINSIGQKVYSQTIEQQFIRLDTSNYQTGVYFIQMTTTENQVVSKSIMVN